MDYTKSIESVSALKTRSAELIRRVQESGQPIIITQNGKATAVLQDLDTFQRQREALLLLKFLARGDEELRDGKAVEYSDSISHFERSMKELKGLGPSFRPPEV